MSKILECDIFASDERRLLLQRLTGLDQMACFDGADLGSKFQVAARCEFDPVFYVVLHIGLATELLGINFWQTLIASAETVCTVQILRNVGFQALFHAFIWC